MQFIKTSFLRLFLTTVFVVSVADSVECQTRAQQVLDRILENWRWSWYWYGRTGIDDIYREGKTVSALVFWTKSEARPIRGFCSPDIAVCIAYVGVYFDPKERRVPISSGTPSRVALSSFLANGLRDASHPLQIGR